jgi:acyl-CoA synthetase (AMP-forming)/AMP-acid ligase II
MIFGIDEEARRDRIAFIDGPSEHSLTYAQLCSEVERCRESLAAANKSLVFHFCANTLSSVAWYLGALEAGHAVALLPESLDAGLRQGLIDAFQPEFVLVPESSEPLRQAMATSAPGIHPELTLLLSTSGTTGSPKLVRLSRQNVESNARAIQSALGITENDRPIAHLPLHYSYGISVINSHLMAGATTVLTSASVLTPGFWKTVSAHGVSSISGVPYTYQMLRRIDLDKVGAHSLVSMTQAGGKLDDKTLLHFEGVMARRGGGLWVMYGQTEAAPRMTTLPAARLKEKIGSVGVALPGGSLSISVDGELTTQPDVVGELVYKGPNVMWGYGLCRADLSRGDELGGVLHTGDRARLDAEGYLYILGRATRDAKVFGLRINMDEVEALVKVHGPAAVVGGTDKLIVHCAFGTPDQLRDVQLELSAKLRLHASALDFRRIESLPTNERGKTNYAELMAAS